MTDRSLICSQAALTRLATTDPREVAQSAWAGRTAKYLRLATEQAEAKGETLTAQETARRAKCLERAFMKSIARKSAKARATK